MAVPGSDMAIVSDGPSSATDKRTHVNANISSTAINTTDVTLHTVTSGSTFYVKSINVFLTSTLTSISVCSFRDNTTVRIPFIAEQLITGQDNGYTKFRMEFPEPIPFTSKFNVYSANASGVSASITVVGYEEINGYR